MVICMLTYLHSTFTAIVANCNEIKMTAVGMSIFPTKNYKSFLSRLTLLYTCTIWNRWTRKLDLSHDREREACVLFPRIPSINISKMRRDFFPSEEVIRPNKCCLEMWPQFWQVRRGRRCNRWSSVMVECRRLNMSPGRMTCNGDT